MRTDLLSLVVSRRLLVVVLMLAAVLRVYKLGGVPPGLTPDEAALGYNAYSILTTGKDEHGNLLPLIFTSFGDYKPGLYVYISIPFVFLFGLTEFAVRLPSALSGIISVYLIYLIVKLMVDGQWLMNNKTQSSNINHKPLAIFASLVAAINPWLIHFSRGAWETNVVLTLILAGIYFFLMFLKSPKFLFLSAIFFSLTLTAYQGAKLSTPIVLFVLLAVFRKDIVNRWSENKTIFVKSFLVGFVIAMPVILSFFQGRTGRLSINSVFSYPRPIEYTNEFLDKAGESLGDVNYFVYHSEPLNFARGIAGRWFNHFSGRFLFFDGDYQNPRHSSPNYGMMLLVDLLLIPLGVFYLVRKNSKFSKFVFLWLFLAPLPAILSRDQVHAVRAISMSVPLVIISGAGLYYLVDLFRNFSFKTSIYFLLSVFYLLSFVVYLDSYFVHLPKHNAQYWFYGFREAVLEVLPLMDSYDKIVFQQSYSQPYVYFLFYGAKDYPDKFAPSVFQKQERYVGDSADVSLVDRLGKIEFQFFSWPPATGDGKTLIVGDSVSVPDNFSRDEYTLIKEIKNPDGFSTAFRIIEKF